MQGSANGLKTKVFFFTPLIVDSLKCYHCKGPDDGRPYPMETCEKEETEMTCTTLNNMEMACGRYHHEINSSASVHEVEGRACVPKQDCHWIGMSCRAIILAGGDCEYSCCDEDFCNNVSSLSADNCLIAGGYFCGLLYLYKLTFSN